jgi:hypothetical protein
LPWPWRASASKGSEFGLGKVKKERRNPLIQTDRPWESSLNDLYPNVLCDEQEKPLRELRKRFAPLPTASGR